MMQEEDRYQWKLDKEQRERKRTQEAQIQELYIIQMATITSSYKVVTKLVIY